MGEDSRSEAPIRGHVNVGEAVRRFASGNRNPQNRGGKNSSPRAKRAWCHRLGAFRATRKHVGRRVRARGAPTTSKFDRGSELHPWPGVQLAKIYVTHGYPGGAPPGRRSGVNDAASAGNNTKRAYGFKSPAWAKQINEPGDAPCGKHFGATPQQCYPNVVWLINAEGALASG